MSDWDAICHRCQHLTRHHRTGLFQCQVQFCDCVESMPYPIIKWTTTNQGKQPRIAKIGDVGYDLFISRDIEVAGGSFVDVHHDVFVELPEGVWGRITGRSSTWRSRGLLVMEGIIDNGYRGELFCGIFNPRSTPVQLDIGERIAQFILHQDVRVSWESILSVAELAKSERGNNGFGSTGY